MGFSIEEDPVGVLEDFLAGINNTGLNESRRVEDFTSKVSGGRNDYESSNEHQDTEGYYLWKTETQLSGPDSHLLR
jgi:hypothetical protein